MFRSILIAFSILGMLFLAFYLFRVKEYSTIEEAILEPEKVEFLNLTGKGLTTLSPEITQLTNMEILWLQENPDLDWNEACNQLQQIPKLRALVLSTNDLKKLPSCLTDLKSIAILDLSNNPDLDWTETFEVLRKMPGLTVLSLTNCNLKTLPPQVIQLKGLQKIFLWNNSISPENQALLNRLLPGVSLEFVSK